MKLRIYLRMRSKRTEAVCVLFGFFDSWLWHEVGCIELTRKIHLPLLNASSRCFEDRCRYWPTFSLIDVDNLLFALEQFK